MDIWLTNQDKSIVRSRSMKLFPVVFPCMIKWTRTNLFANLSCMLLQMSCMLLQNILTRTNLIEDL